MENQKKIGSGIGEGKSTCVDVPPTILTPSGKNPINQETSVK